MIVKRAIEHGSFFYGLNAFLYLSSIQKTHTYEKVTDGSFNLTIAYRM